MLPHDFPPYPTVWSFFRRAKESGLWDTILAELVKKKRLKAGRTVTPTYAIIDSQSVNTTDVAENRGIDGGKKIKGRKRHIVVDTMENLLDVVVHAANLHDTKSGILVARKVMAQHPTIKAFSADAGYRKSFEEMMLKEFQCPVDSSEKLREAGKLFRNVGL